MKKTSALIFGILITINLFTGCSKKDNNTPPPIQQVKNWKMSAIIGTTTLETDSVNGFINTDSFSGVTSIVVGGVNNGDSALAIGVLYGIDPGNYDLSKGSGYNLTFVTGNNTQYISTSGTLYIGSNSNNSLAGNFNATMTEITGSAIGSTVSIKNGFCRISY